MPNSAACLIELTVSCPALARPTIFAFELCACKRKDEKSEALSGIEHVAQHLAPVGLDDVAGVLLQRVAESVVHGDEVPGVAAGLHQRAARRDRERVRVKGPVEAVGRAGRARDRRRRRADDDVDLLLLGGDSLHRKRDRGRREVGDHVDAFGVVPAARDVAGEIGLVLVIGGDQLDLLAEHAAAEILDRHFRRFDRPLAAIVGVDPGLIVQNADLDALRRRRRAREQAACDERRRTPIESALPLPIMFSSRFLGLRAGATNVARRGHLACCVGL